MCLCVVCIDVLSCVGVHMYVCVRMCGNQKLLFYLLKQSSVAGFGDPVCASEVQGLQVGCTAHLAYMQLRGVPLWSSCCAASHLPAQV